MDLTGIIKTTLESQPEEEPRRYIGASSIGKACNRSIWYAFSGVRGQVVPASLRITFDVGKYLEGMLSDYVELSGIRIERPNEANNYLFVQDEEVPIFQGHMDAVIYFGDTPSAVLEIKTAKHSSFQHFKKHGLKDWSPSYYAQLQAYMGMGGFSRAVILVLDKDTSELHHEWIIYDDIFYHELRMKALAISTIGEPPEKINKSPFYFICSRCQFKNICHFTGEAS